MDNESRTKKYKAIFFDAGNTLFHVFPSVGHVYAAISNQFGNRKEPEKIDERFMLCWDQWSSQHPFPVGRTAEDEFEWWHGLVRLVMESDGAMMNFDDFFAAVYEKFSQADVWRLFPEVLAVLEHCRKQEVVMGIVSNWDSRLMTLCRRLGIADKFDFIFASAQVGVSKPNPEIFYQALTRAGVGPEEACHIGDSIHDDIGGARRAGLDVLWINRHHYKEPPQGVRVIHSLEAVMSIC